MDNGTEEASNATLVFQMYGFPLLGIIMAWTSAFCGGLFVSLGTQFLSIKFLHTNMVREPDAPQLSLLLFFIPAGLCFGSVLALFQGSASLSFLPHGARRKWVLASFLAGIAYWIMVVALQYYILTVDSFGLVAALQRTERQSAAGTGILLYIAAAGALIGILSGITLGVVQWVFLRNYISKAKHWIIATVVTSTAIYTMLTWCSYWFSGGDSWN